MKKTLLLLVAVLITTTINAQQFDWATSFTGGNAENKVSFSATDSQGNLYIAGQCGTGAAINGTVLLNMAPYGSGCNHSNFFIAKLSPNGQVIWRKAIHNNNGGITYCHNMQMLGDTAIAVLVNYSLATQDEYLYYLDTLVVATGYNQPYANYPFTFSGGSSDGVGFIILDLNGNLKEHHFIQVAFLDTNGHSINYNNTINENNDSTPPYANGAFSGYFRVDNEGYLYMSRNTNDICYVACDTCAEMFEEYSLENGKLSGLRFIVDGQRTFDYMPNGNGEKLGANNAMLLKFSPHFNNLIWAKYMIKDTVGNGANPITMQPYITGMTGDNEGNIYACGYIDHSVSIVDTNYYRTLILDSNNLNQTITLKHNMTFASFLIKYNSNGNVIWSDQIKTEPISNVINKTFACLNFAVNINETNNSVYTLSEVAQGSFIDTVMQYNFILANGDTNSNHIYHNNAMFIRYNKDNGQYISNGIAKSDFATSIYSCYANTAAIESRNNQVVAQIGYNYNLYGRDTVYQLNTINDQAIAFVRWDEDGHTIDAVDYDAISTSNRIGSLSLDNNGNLYLTGTITSGASFGTNTLTNGAYIAKYTDSTFNTPYIYQSIGEIQDIGRISIYPNPTQNEINITTQQERIKSCTLTTLDGKEYNLRPIMNDSNGAKINIESMPIGTYILTIKTNKNIYHNKVVKIK